MLPKYYQLGYLHLAVSFPLIMLLVISYFANMEVEVTSWRNLVQIFVGIEGVLLAFVFHGNLRLGIEFNRLVGQGKSEFLSDYWERVKRDLVSMYLSLGALIFLLVLLIVFEKRIVVPSNDVVFILSIADFIWFFHSLGGALVGQYLSFEALGKTFSRSQTSEEQER